MVKHECERLKKCPTMVTKNYFTSFCNTKNFESCFHYARWKKTAKTPFQWLQEMAVEHAKRAGQLTQMESPL